MKCYLASKYAEQSIGSMNLKVRRENLARRTHLEVVRPHKLFEAMRLEANTFKEQCEQRRRPQNELGRLSHL